MDQNNVLKQWRDKVSTQSYAAAAKIDGVEFFELREFSDCGGTFSELVRLTDGHLELKKGFSLRQVNYSVMESGSVKAFHLHYRQSELWFVPPSERLIMGLFDVRSESLTSGLSMRFIMGAHKPRLLFIPAGVAHGAANPYPTSVQVIYFSDQQFSLDQPDEQRLPWDTLGQDFWQIKKE